MTCFVDFINGGRDRGLKTPASISQEKSVWNQNLGLYNCSDFLSKFFYRLLLVGIIFKSVLKHSRVFWV